MPGEEVVLSKLYLEGVIREEENEEREGGKGRKLDRWLG